MGNAVEEIVRRVRAAERMRADAMPTEAEALLVMQEANKRLEELGYQNAIYCPKDGTVFHAIEPGSTAAYPCHYDGEWPNGRWWAHEDCDLWPCRPALFRLIPVECIDCGEKVRNLRNHCECEDNVCLIHDPDTDEQVKP